MMRCNEVAKIHFCILNYTARKNFTRNRAEIT